MHSKNYNATFKRNNIAIVDAMNKIMSFKTMLTFVCLANVPDLMHRLFEF